VVCSAISAQVTKCVPTQTSNSCQLDSNQNMFAQSDRQVKPESPSYVLIDQSFVKAITPPVAATSKVFGAIIGDAESFQDDSGLQKTIVEYEVEQNDTLTILAEKFNISVDTIRWANDLTKSSTLKAGQKLIIPPVDGIVHYVVSGDTIAKISQNYGAKPENIIAFNELSGENDVFVGDVLIVPGGKLSLPKTPSQVAQTSSGVLLGQTALPQNYFLCPVGAVCKITQGLHFRNAVDLTTDYCGAPIYAAASGIVTKAKFGWNGGAGNNIAISHLGGAVITHYYHLQSISVVQGQEVKKGDVIGSMGRTGKSTGCHLHFEVIGAANPFAK